MVTDEKNLCSVHVLALSKSIVATRKPLVHDELAESFSRKIWIQLFLRGFFESFEKQNH